MTDVITSRRGDRIGFDRRGDGPMLIFIAGAGPFRAIDPVTTETAVMGAEQGLSTVVFDRLGRGDSAADGPLDLDRELDAVAALIGSAAGPAVLCGHSSGCAIALRAAAAGLPVAGLALWEAPLAGHAADTEAWAEEILRRMDTGDHQGATEHFMKDMPPEWLAGLKDSPEWSMIAAGVVSQRADAMALAWAQAAIENADLSAITVPVQCMYGTETFPEMPRAAAMIADVLPAATVKEMPGAGHSWEPEPMAAELVTFVRRCLS